MDDTFGEENILFAIAGQGGLPIASKMIEGKVRNSRLLLQSSAELRKCLETGVKLHQAMREVSAIDANARRDHWGNQENRAGSGGSHLSPD